ncbi:S-layer homology domain-containing protein [Butyricicoccus faecihominis]|uniref:S-layer homology domain-containing protein n=1 Tax=Butyricicoccus faecihominis TaxID=1712515 RepID=UPI0024787180|nr:S-layer homology domain-containing protein [Butyricicoccus faecihominis]MCQ5129407.1 S-layer homology domain-containing protein [Butyricicoccus faecihominis]
MKNLKKILALVLAFACAFTMFAGAASFSDSADIKNTEAVDMLNALGVIKGYPDGTFKPQANVLRAEMAKMIYTIRNQGNDNADGYKTISSTFTDLGDSSIAYAAGYIKYCQTQGIIAGKSATKFAPKENVTVSETAKMALTLLGYDATKAGLVGHGWENKTLALANENGLLDGVNGAVTAAATRDDAAQVLYNALNADTVKWDADSSTYVKVETQGLELMNNPSQWVTVTKNETMGKKWMKLDTVESKTNSNIVTAVEKEDGRDTYKVTVAGQTFTRVEKDYSDLMGQDVKIMIKDNDKSKVYGLYAGEDTKVLATGYVGGLDTDGTATDKVKLNDVSYKLNRTLTTQSAYAFNKDTTAVSLNDLVTMGKTTKAAKATNGVAAQVKLIDNDGDGKADYVSYVPSKVGKVTSVTKTAVNVNNTVGQLKFDDDDIYEGIAKDEYVAFIDGDNTASTKDTLVKLDKITAKAQATRTNEVKINDSWYKIALDMGVSVTTGNTYDLYVVGNFVVSADETAAESTSVAYISAIDNKADGSDVDMVTGEHTGTLDARMYFQDNTNAVVKISKVDGNKIVKASPSSDEVMYNDASVPSASSLVTYSKLSDGTYDVKIVSSSNKAGFKSYVTPSVMSGSSNGVYYKQKIGGMSIMDDATIFVQTGKETKVLTGKQVKNWSDTVNPLVFSGAVLTKESNGIAYVKVASLTASQSNNVPGSGKDTLYAYLVSDAAQADKNGEKKVAFDVWTADGAKTLYEDTSSVNGSAIAGTLISYTVNGDFIEQISYNPGYAVAVTGFDGAKEGEISFYYANSATQQYTLDEDCVFIAVNDKDTKGMEGGIESVPSSAEENTAGTAYYTNARIVLNSDGDVAAILYDLENNKMYPEVTYNK